MEKSLNEISIHLTYPHNLKQIFQLETDSFHGGGYPFFFFRQALDCMGEFFIVAEIESDLVGYILGTLQAERPDAWILGMAVSKDIRKRGVGSILLKRLLKIFKNKGAKFVMLHVSPDNKPALKLYRKLGFVEINQEKNYFGVGQSRKFMKMNFY